jgi:hypothetical protein
MITTDKKQVDMQQYIIMVTGISSPTFSKVILFHVRISVLGGGEESSLYLNFSHTLNVYNVTTFQDPALNGASTAPTSESLHGCHADTSDGRK